MDDNRWGRLPKRGGSSKPVGPSLENTHQILAVFKISTVSLSLTFVSHVAASVDET